MKLVEFEKKKMVEVQDSKRITDVLEGFVEYTSSYQRKTERSQHVTWLDLKTLGF